MIYWTKRKKKCEAEESGQLVLKEHEAARWLAREELNEVDWLPADEDLIERLKTAEWQTI